MSQMLAREAAMLPLFAASDCPALSAWASSNDLAFSFGTPAACFAQWQAYLAAANAAAPGKPVITFTVMPRFSPGQSPTFEADRLAFNLLMRGLYPNATSITRVFDDGAGNYMLDVGADPILGVDGVQFDATWFLQETGAVSVHPSTNGNNRIANDYFTPLLRIL